MAKIDWTPQFLQRLDYHIGYAAVEFGKPTAMRWAKEMASFEARVKVYPTSCTPESLLHGKKKLYRRYHLMNRRFKVIYYYDDKADIVHLVDIWDTRMDSKMLVKRIKEG